MVGYAKQHLAGTYRMYKIDKNSIVESRDVTWNDWSRPDPKRNVSIFVQQPTTLKEIPGIDDKEAVLEITSPSAPNLIPPEEEALPPESEAGRKKTVKFDTSSSETSGQTKADHKATCMQHELQNLDDAWDPVTRDIMNKATVIESDEAGNEIAKEIHFVFNV
jgi:hypothetical protein